MIFGEANWAPIKDTDLLYVSNSQGNLFKDITTQKTYILLSGRWFEAPSLDGPWAFVAPEKLPRRFRQDPRGLPGGQRARVGAGHRRGEGRAARRPDPADGDDQAQPGDARGHVRRDPQFKPIEGTKLEFAVNTSSSVIKLDSTVLLLPPGGVVRGGRPAGPVAGR